MGLVSVMKLKELVPELRRSQGLPPARRLPNVMGIPSGLRASTNIVLFATDDDVIERHPLTGPGAIRLFKPLGDQMGLVPINVIEVGGRLYDLFTCCERLCSIFAYDAIDPKLSEDLIRKQLTGKHQLLAWARRTVSDILGI